MKTIKRLLLGVTLGVLLVGCTADEPIIKKPTIVEVTYYNTTDILPTNNFSGQTLKWSIIEKSFINETSSTLYFIRQDMDFNFYDGNKCKSKLNKSGTTTFPFATWNKFYTITNIKLVKKYKFVTYSDGSSTIDEEIIPTNNNVAGFPRKEFYITENSTSETYYYLVGSDNKIKTN